MLKNLLRFLIGNTLYTINTNVYMILKTFIFTHLLITFRYYHLFKKGELDGLFENIDGVTVDVAGYDRDNHYVIVTKL